MAQTLAGFDMTLALSQTTINQQFRKLHQQNIIHQNWKLLAGNVFRQSPRRKPFMLKGSDVNFSSRLNIWQGLQEDFVKTGDFAMLGALKESGNNFDFGWDAALSPPAIHIEDRKSQEVIFDLKFKSGFLYYLSDPQQTVSKYDLKGLVYSFKVPIGRLKIDNKAMTLNAQNEMKSVVRDSGLRSSDFNIESLFLNFRNAKISQFDVNRSKFPPGIADRLSVGINNYFNLILPGKDNPFVLGYGVSRKKNVWSDKAMFQPTSVAYSTTYSSRRGRNQTLPGQFSAINFLMMANGHKAPTNQTGGIMAQSLIELGKAQQIATNGVFAIEHSLFMTYIQSLDKYVEGIFSSQSGVNINGGFKSGTMKATQRNYHKDDTIDTTYTLSRQPIKNLSTGGIEIRYGLKVHIRVGIHIGKKWEIKSASLSTAGQYTKGDINKKGAEGALVFQLKTGTGGRFKLDNKLTKPAIAFDENPNMFEGPVGKVIGNIVTVIFAWPMAIVNGIIGQIVADLGVNTVVKENALINSLNQLDLLNKTNKVILPLGNTFNYKNLRYLADKKVLLYDIGYK